MHCHIFLAKTSDSKIIDSNKNDACSSVYLWQALFLISGIKACSTFHMWNDALTWKAHSLHCDKKVFVTHVCRILNDNNNIIANINFSNKHYHKQVGFILAMCYLLC